MWCLGNGAKRTIGKALAFAALLAGLSGALSWGVVTYPPNAIPRRSTLTQLEKTLRHESAHISEFAPVLEPLALHRCGEVHAPEALLTPDPLLGVGDGNLHVRVSFIVGSDGRVHSAFVLESGGPDEDQIVLRTIRFWRYRPALCNGVPTEYEALVRFSIR